MKNQYLFVPWNIFDAEVSEWEGGPDQVLAEFKRRARATSSKATLFLLDKSSRRGLKLLYMVDDRELRNGTGEVIGTV